MSEAVSPYLASSPSRLAARPPARDTPRVARFPERTVSLQELESAVSQLPAEELNAFARWFEEYMADAWDRRIEEDIKAGRLDRLAEEALQELREGRCTDL